jgi:hypothetical protein
VHTTEHPFGGSIRALDTTFTPRLERRVIVFGLTAAYIAALRYSYVRLIAPQFAYMHYAYRPLNIWIEVISWLLMLLPSLWLAVDCKRPSQMVLWYLYLLVVVPGILVPQFALSVSISELLWLSFALSAALHVVGFVPKLPLLTFPRPRLSARTFWALVGTFTIALYAYVLHTFGASFAIPSLQKVYSTRFAYKAQLAQGGALVGYAVLWLAEVVNPLLIAVGLTRKRYWLVATAVAGQALLLATTGFKSIVISSMLLAALLLMLRRDGKGLGILLVGGGSVLVVLCALLDRAAHTIMFTSVLVRRAIMTPGLLTGIYYEYFSQHQPVMLASSFLRPLVETTYSLPPAQQIGAVYFEGPQSNANANIWADAYANFRYPGIVFMTVALCVILWLVDSLTAQRARKDAFLFLAVPALALCNSSLQTVFISHGIGLILLFNYLMPADAREDGSASGSVLPMIPAR